MFLYFFFSLLISLSAGSMVGDGNRYVGWSVAEKSHPIGNSMP
jgi:hypothetical protein